MQLQYRTRRHITTTTTRLSSSSTAVYSDYGSSVEEVYHEIHHQQHNAHDERHVRHHRSQPAMTKVVHSTRRQTFSQQQQQQRQNRPRVSSRRQKNAAHLRRVMLKRRHPNNNSTTGRAQLNTTPTSDADESFESVSSYENRDHLPDEFDSDDEELFQPILSQAPPPLPPRSSSSNMPPTSPRHVPVTHYRANEDDYEAPVYARLNKFRPGLPPKQRRRVCYKAANSLSAIKELSPVQPVPQPQPQQPEVYAKGEQHYAELNNNSPHHRSPYAEQDRLMRLQALSRSEQDMPTYATRNLQQLATLNASANCSMGAFKSPAKPMPKTNPYFTLPRSFGQTSLGNRVRLGINFDQFAEQHQQQQQQQQLEYSSRSLSQSQHSVHMRQQQQQQHSMQRQSRSHSRPVSYCAPSSASDQQQQQQDLMSFGSDRSSSRCSSRISGGTGGRPHLGAELRSFGCRGQLYISIEVIGRSLTIYVDEAHDLVSPLGRPCNAYVKLSLKPDDLKRTRHHTRIVRASDAPVFNEKFTIELLPEDRHRKLLISAFTRERDQTSHLLGCMTFSVRSVLRNKKPIDGWYFLLPRNHGTRKHLAAENAKMYHFYGSVDSGLEGSAGSHEAKSGAPLSSLGAHNHHHQQQSHRPKLRSTNTTDCGEDSSCSFAPLGTSAAANCTTGSDTDASSCHQQHSLTSASTSTTGSSSYGFFGQWSSRASPLRHAQSVQQSPAPNSCHSAGAKQRRKRFTQFKELLETQRSKHLRGGGSSVSLARSVDVGGPTDLTTGHLTAPVNNGTSQQSLSLKLPRKHLANAQVMRCYPMSTDGSVEVSPCVSLQQQGHHSESLAVLSTHRQLSQLSLDTHDQDALMRRAQSFNSRGVEQLEHAPFASSSNDGSSCVLQRKTSAIDVSDPKKKRSLRLSHPNPPSPLPPSPSPTTPRGFDTPTNQTSCHSTTGRQQQQQQQQSEQQQPTAAAAAGAIVRDDNNYARGHSNLNHQYSSHEIVASSNQMTDSQSTSALNSAVPFPKKLSFLSGARKKSSGAEGQTSKLSKEEVHSWAASFEALMRNKHGVALFRAFLQREFSDENIDFWIAVQEFKNSTKQEKMPEKARSIYDEFVAVQSTKEVNLDSDTRSSIATASLEQPTAEIFDVAISKVEHLMSKDSYPRFLKSDLYVDLANTCKK